LERAQNQAAFAFLAARGVMVRWAPPSFSASHEKAVVVDTTVAAVMTLNFTSRYYASSRDLAIVDSDAADVAAIEAVFNADFAGRPGPEPAGDDLVWSPGSQPALVALIASARVSVAVENEEMALPAVTAALAAAARRGVKVTVVMTYQSQWGAPFAQLSAAGVAVRVFHGEAPIYIHAKTIVVDAGSGGGRVFIGSENFSAASLGRNRELGLILAAPAVVSAVSSTVAGDFGGAAPWR
jgi:phosphatidylserine/phosphatidylglycerophosphate/cardiolipin synthase-like enzyme